MVGLLLFAIVAGAGALGEDGAAPPKHPAPAPTVVTDESPAREVSRDDALWESEQWFRGGAGDHLVPPLPALDGAVAQDAGRADDPDTGSLPVDDEPVVPGGDGGGSGAGGSSGAEDVAEDDGADDSSDRGSDAGTDGGGDDPGDGDAGDGPGETDGDDPVGDPGDDEGPADPVVIDRFMVEVAGACDRELLDHVVRWSTAGADEVTLAVGDARPSRVGTAGQANHCTARGTVFTLTATGPGGTQTDRASAG